MKHPCTLLIPVLGLVFSGPLSAQDTDDAETLLSNPRFQSMLRSVKNDPEGTLEGATSDTDSLVDQATRLFQEGQKKVESSGIDTPENRAKAERLSEMAVDRVKQLQTTGEPSKEVEKLSEMAIDQVGQLQGEEKPAAEATRANVPATRSASTTNFVKPIAMPLDETPKPLATETMPDRIIQEETVEPIATAAPTQPVIPDFALAQADIPAPQPLSPKYDTKNTAGFRTPADKDAMVITARESLMDNNRGVLVFTGNVFVQYPNLDIQCEKLEIELGGNSGAEGGQSFQRAIASGGMVEVTRIVKDEKGKQKKQIAMARQVIYDQTTGDAVLSGGPPYIQDGDSFVETNSPDAQIIMRGDNKFEIKGTDAGSKNRTRIVIPIPKSKGGAGNIGIGGGLGDMLDQGQGRRGR